MYYYYYYLINLILLISFVIMICLLKFILTGSRDTSEIVRQVAKHSATLLLFFSLNFKNSS